MFPYPERFEKKIFSGFFVQSVSIGKHEGQVALVLNSAEANLSLIFQASPAKARQLAASILNQADEVERA